MAAFPVFTNDLSSILINLHESGNKTQIIKLIENDVNIIMNTDYSTMRMMGMSDDLIVFCRSVAREYQRSTHQDSVPLSNIPSTSPPGTYDLLDSWDISSPNVAAYHSNTGTDCNVKHTPRYTDTSYNTIYAELPCTSSATLPTDTPLTKSTTLSINKYENKENGRQGQDERLGTDIANFKPDAEQNLMHDVTATAIEDMRDLAGTFIETISVNQSSDDDSEKESETSVKLAKLHLELKMMKMELKNVTDDFNMLIEYVEKHRNIVTANMDIFTEYKKLLSRRLDTLIQKVKLLIRENNMEYTTEEENLSE